MGWCKNGSTIKADYLGNVVTGVVTESRVKYGGKVQYTVEMEEPVFFRWRGNEPVYRVLICEDNVISDFGIIMENV
jgi:hypothetical protein